jgi:AAA+ ATPase superfamily predicted ATPase
MFIGRLDELNTLYRLLEKPSASVMIYGKRKVGKTTLISEALKASTDKTIYYECLKAPMQENIDGFVAMLVYEKILPVQLTFKSFTDVFAYMNTVDATFNVVIDEYPYLKAFAKPETVDSIFQSVIDNNLKNIRLFISGSHIGMMKDLLEEKNALYGRFTTTICLKELDYLTASEFYKGKSVYDKIAMYAVFGGSPYINCALDEAKSLKENIIATLLNPTSYVYNYAEHLLISDYTNAINAERIFYAISNGKRKYSEIEERLGLKANGNLSKQLNSLEKMDIIAKTYPINKLDDKKKVSYEVRDNLLRFYYAFIYKNKSALQMIGAEAFYEEYIEGAIITFISHRFEEIARTYFSLCVQKGKLRGISNIGTFYYDDSTTRSNGEFDVVLEHKDTYDIYGVKYYSEPMQLREIHEEVAQINAIKGLRIGKIGFIATAGYEETPDGYDFIDINNLYNI